MVITEQNLKTIFNLTTNNEPSSTRSFLVYTIDLYGFPYVLNQICAKFVDEDEDEVKDAVIKYVQKK